MVVGSYVSPALLAAAAGTVCLAAAALRRAALGLILAVALLLGWLRWHQATAVRPGDVSFLATGGERVVVGTVADEPELLGERQRVVLSGVHVDGRLATGNVRASFSRYPRYSYGQQLQLRCELSPAEASPGVASLRRRGIGALCGRASGAVAIGGGAGGPRGWMLQLRQKMRASVNASLPEPQSSLLAGILWGERASLPQRIQDDFKAAGMSHQVAVSGFNTSIIAAALAAVLFRLGLGRGWVALLSAVGIAGFAVLSGGSAAVVRAAAMSSAVLAARFLGRPAAAGYVLVVAASAMALLNPWLVYDVGFQLSLAATAGLVYVSPALQPFLGWLPERFGLRENVATTLAATLSTLPITVAHFGQFSIIGLLANAVTLPLLPLTMAVGGIAVGAGLLWQPLGAAAGLVAWLPLTYLLGAAHLSASVPGAAVVTQPLGWWAACLYLPLVAFVYRGRSVPLCPAVAPAPSS